MNGTPRLNDAAPAAERSAFEAQRGLASAVDILPGPLAGAAATVAVVADRGTAVEAGTLTLAALLVAAAVMDGRSRHSALLPFMGVAGRATGPLAGVLLLAVLESLTTLPGVGALGFVAVAAAASVAAAAADVVARRVRQPAPRLRVAVIGGAHAAQSLARELTGARNSELVVVGRIRLPSDGAATDSEVPTLGSLDALGALVERHRIDLLLMTAEVPRLAVFDEISNSCLHLPVRLQELASFYEDTFGHVPVAEINAAWFQYIMHPRYRAASPLAQRALDIVVSGIALLVLAPLMAVLALVIRRDGGPALFSQLRIGEGGRSFTIWKLRTMRVGASSAWAGAEDARVTRIGRLLRKTHVDELPQLYNILVGDMSLVGPRPEQPAFVERLERSVPFYSRRHLIKPGLTGWAQVRCGYAGSDVGSAWKVSHDLYYLKHKSFRLNLMILGETLRTLVADRQYTAEPSTVAFILRADEPKREPAAPAVPDWPAAAPVVVPAGDAA